ncbi:MAG: helix-turn-helix transcriptional regulator [Leptolyngbyaceae cyanobacterium SM1_4_3]|nr:helix-turn-helix transcriptional regulator [Leptolyngbyaceae cyanobacterium SM1_4_3]
MTLILNESGWDKLHEQAPVTCPDNLTLDAFEKLWGVPEFLGQGYSREVDLLPGVWLCFSQVEYHQDLIVKTPAHDHPIQISIFPSGLLYFDDVHPNLGGDRSYFSGSGISPATAGKHCAGEHSTCVNIEIDPELFNSGFLMDQPRNSDALKSLFKGEDWKVSFYPSVTPAIQAIAQQMWDAPYRGELKRLYLQAKVMELLVIYLDLIAEDRTQTRIFPGLKPETIARLHHAKEILDTRLENPPSILELAQQAGLSDRTLQRGFRAVFQTTVMGYLKQQRLKQAERLLRQGNHTVAEVANLVGYGHLGHFATAFKQRFGIAPRQCLAGKRGIG